MFLDWAWLRMHFGFGYLCFVGLIEPESRITLAKSGTQWNWIYPGLIMFLRFKKEYEQENLSQNSPPIYLRRCCVFQLVTTFGLALKRLNHQITIISENVISEAPQSTFFYLMEKADLVFNTFTFLHFKCKNTSW